jgi:signal transduction histidine kinase
VKSTRLTSKLTIRSKLAAALLVPLAMLALFAASQVQTASEQRDRVHQQAGLATSATGPSGLLTALASERDFQTMRAIGAQGQLAGGPKNQREAIRRTDGALSSFRNQLSDLGGRAGDNYRSTLNSVGSELETLRDDADKAESKTASAAGAKQAEQLFDRYTALVTNLLDADQRSGASISDAELRSGAELLNALARQRDIEARVAITAGIARLAGDPVAKVEAQGLAGRMMAGNDDLVHVRADGVYRRAILGPITREDRETAVAQLNAVANDPGSADLKTMLAAVPNSSRWLGQAATATAVIVQARADNLTEAATNEQRNWIAITIGFVVLAMMLLWLANRWITRPLKSLADQATAMATERLPEAVRAILDTPTDADVMVPDVEPVKVRAGGEVLEVAEALNQVQDSAVQLAVEQATLRRNVADAYVNLGRRNQNLLSRQLEFITNLENDESDPETLEHLFKLDHLATRMRRNAESLLVLAGHAPPRTWGAPVAVGDVVRGALGEVEGYQRVRLRHLDDAEVDGAAAADVSHVVAELTENALAFSPPDADVEIYGRRDEHGYVLTIVDAGIGMPAEDLERANALISSANALTFAPSRFLGHYVVAQLAQRHGLGVHLAASPAGGITAMIGLPPVLLGMQPAPEVPEADVAEPIEAAAVVEAAEPLPARPVAALPRRDSAPEAETESLVSAPEPNGPAPEHDALVAGATVLAFAAPEPQPVTPVAHTEPEAPVLEAVPDAELVGFVAPAPESAPEPVATASAETVVAPDPAPEPPVEQARPRIGVGSFADLRATPTPRTAEPQPDPAADPAPAPVASTPDAPTPDAPTPGAPTGHREVDSTPPDRRVAFSEVAQAVDVAAGRAEADAPAATFSEDLLPNRLPKRGRRSSKAVWSREKPAKPQLAPPPAPVASPAPESPNTDTTLATPESAVTTASDETPKAPTGDGDRLAFFAAFRSAAEQAREEAGIDDRRVGH